MSSSIVARRGALTALTVFAAAVLFFVGLAQGSASAAEVKGSAVITISSGKAGKAFAIKPVKGKRVGKKGIRATAPARSLSVGSTAKVGLRGGIRLTNGKRSVRITALSLSVGKNVTTVRGKLGKKNLVVFTAKGKAKLNKTAKSVKLSGGKLTLPGSVAKRIKRTLKLKKAPTGRIGGLNINAWIKGDDPVDPCEVDPNAEGCQPDPCEVDPNAEGCPITDPYLAQCNVDATAKVVGSLAPAPAPPAFTGDPGVTGPEKIRWGFKQSFRNYVTTFAGGALHALDGATLAGTAPAYSAFEFPSSGFRYTDSGTPDDMTDDKAVLEGTGTALFCATGHEFRIALSNPTVVIDGANSRIDADVDANLSGTWIPTQRITVASLKVGAVTRENSGTGSKIKWNAVPASLTEEGTAAFCGTGELDKCSTIYPPGTALDPITVELDVVDPITVTDPYQAECGVGTSGRIDGLWAPASTLPDPASSLATTEPASVNWGLKGSFRQYVYGVMAGAGKGASALQALDGASRAPGGDPTRGFSFPVSGGEYAINDPVDMTDDQAVINGTGTSLICNNEHGFWIKVANPTIVIDGADSRIVADISSNETGIFAPSKRVDLADLDLTGITPFYNKSGSEVSWGSIPAKLSSEAAPFATYGAGESLDPVTVSLKTPYDTGAGDAAAWNALATYVSTNHPFPLPDPAQGGCTLPGTAGGTASAARTVDEHASYGGTTAAWNASGGQPQPEPDFSTGQAVSAGNFDWGFRRALRGSLNSTGDFNLFGGATASNPYFGNGGELASRPSQMANSVAEPSKYFRWPSSSGYYKANGAGNGDDQLVLRTAGRVAFCQVQSAQQYATIFTDPTIVVDGENSRITIDVLTRYRLSWVRGRVDIATLDLSDPAVTVAESTEAGVKTVEWVFPPADESVTPNVGPVELTADGQAVVKLIGSAYLEGVGLDRVAIKASVPAGG